LARRGNAKEPSGLDRTVSPFAAPVLAALFCAMAEIRTVTTLKHKRDEISASIRMYEKKIAQARADKRSAVTNFVKA